MRAPAGLLPLSLPLLLVAALSGCADSDQGQLPPSASPRFQAVDVFVDAGGAPLAAYQIEATYDRRRVKILSLEGGEPEGFRDAPYYDPAGMTAGRIVVAAFVADDAKATAGRQRVARLHLRVEGIGAPLPKAKLVTAARPGGERMTAKVEVRLGGEKSEGKP